MSENTRDERKDGKDTAILLSAIFDYYRALFEGADQESVALCKMVAAGISSESEMHEWGWRYVMSIRNGTIEPSRFISSAIIRHAATVSKKAMPVLVDPCPECGSAPTVCLCDGKRVVKSVPHGTKPRRPRLAIAKDDMESAERSIQNNLPPEQVAELTRRLLKRQELEY